MAQHSDVRFSNVLFYGFVLCLAYLAFRVFEPFLVPLGWAGVFAVIFQSLMKSAEKKWGRAKSAALITTGVTLILIVPVLMLAAMFAREGIVAVRDLQDEIAAGGFAWVNTIWRWIVSHLSARGMSLDFPDLVRQVASRVGGTMAEGLGTVIRNIALFILELFVMLFALFYFLKDGDRIMERFRLILPFKEAMTDRMLTESRDLIFASVTTSLVIGAVQGVICGGAFALLNLSSPFFWGVVMAFLSILPIVGAWPIWIPATIWLISMGHWGKAILLVAMCGPIGGFVDNILRPALVGGRTSLNGLFVFISVLGGLAVFGVLGIILGPIVVATAVGFLDVYSGAESLKGAAEARSD